MFVSARKTVGCLSHTTTALVFDAGNSSLLPPVNRCRQRLTNILIYESSAPSPLSPEHSLRPLRIHRTKLFVAQVSKFVEPKRVCDITPLVVLMNVPCIVLKNVEPLQQRIVIAPIPVLISGINQMGAMGGEPSSIKCKEMHIGAHVLGRHPGYRVMGCRRGRKEEA